MPVFGTLERGFDLFGRHARGLLLVTAAFVVPTEVIVVAIDPSGGWGDVSWGRLLWSTLVLVSGTSVAFIAGALALAAGVRDGRVDVLRTLATTARRAPAGLVLQALVLAGVFLGMLALIVPGLILLTRWFVAFQPFAFEGSGPAASLGRSWELTRGRGWPMFGIVVITLAIGLATGLGTLVLQGIGLPDAVATFVGDSIAGTLATALTTAVGAAAYLHLAEPEPRSPIPSWV